MTEWATATTSYLMLEYGRPPHNTIRGPVESFTPSLGHWIEKGWVDVTQHRLGTQRACPMCRQFRNLTGNATEQFWELGWNEVSARSEVVLRCNRTAEPVLPATTDWDAKADEVRAEYEGES